MTEIENTPVEAPESVVWALGKKGDPESPKFNGTFLRDRGEGRGARVATPKPGDLSLPQDSVSTVLARIEAPKTALKARKTKLAVMGIPAASLQKGTPEYYNMVRMAAKYRKARAKELYENFGYVSIGVSTLLAAESLALGSSRFLYETAASLPALDAASTLKTASALADSARQHGLCAWELCSKESRVRKANDAAREQMPWLISDSGKEKRKPGRPRKVDMNAVVEDTNVKDQNGESYA